MVSVSMKVTQHFKVLYIIVSNLYFAGYIEKDEKKPRPEVKDAEDLSAQNYSIEDKRYE